MTHAIDGLIAQLGGLGRNADERGRIERAARALDAKYGLSEKIAREPGVAEIVGQMFGRLVKAYASLAEIEGQRVLDIACGSSTSKAPPLLLVDTPFSQERVKIPGVEGFTAQFEPWFCRILAELGAEPVGIDIGDLDGEAFEHHHADLGRVGALDFLPGQSFDAAQDSRLFGSPEFTAQFPERADRLAIAAEIRRQEDRVLKPDGKLIHSDAETLVRRG